MNINRLCLSFDPRSFGFLKKNVGIQKNSKRHLSVKSVAFLKSDRVLTTY